MRLEWKLMPNSWTAVVRGALMKGLASASPASATVKVSARSARKHYGFEIEKEFVDIEHDDARKYWDAHAGFYRILEMEWFIQKVQYPFPKQLNASKVGADFIENRSL